MRIVLLGREGGFSSTRNRGISARGKSYEYGNWSVIASTMMNAYLYQAVELRADGLDSVRNTDGVMEDRLGRVHTVSALHK